VDGAIPVYIYLPAMGTVIGVAVAVAVVVPCAWDSLSKKGRTISLQSYAPVRRGISTRHDVCMYLGMYVCT
jgi:chorismate synthase